MADERPTTASATILGREVGLNGSEMNILLKEAGLLEGEPGAYGVTEKGAPYARETDHHRGPGGYPMYNADWTTTSWDRSVLDVLDVTPERRAHAKEIADERRRERAAERAARPEYPGPSDENGNPELDPQTMRVAGVIALMLLTTYGIWKVAPHVKSLYDEKAAPRLRDLRSRVSRHGELEQSRGESDEDPST